MIWRELRLALRRLGRERGFTVAAVVTLALGVGVNAALFTVVRSVLEPRFAVEAPGDLLVLRPRLTPASGAPEDLERFSYPMYQALREALPNPDRRRLAAYTPNPLALNLAVGGPSGQTAHQLRVEIVATEYFSVLGVVPARGRWFSSVEDASPGEAAVVLLSDGLWRGAFGADPDIVGRVVMIEKQPFTVVGVMPPEFHGLSRRAEAWVPMASAPALTFPRRLTGTLSFWHAVVARASVEQRARLEAELRSAARAVETKIPLAENFGAVTLSFRALPLIEATRDPAAGRAVLLLFGATVGVLLVASVNVGALFLVRAVSRARESAVRAALGAGPADRQRRALAESVLVGAAAAALGLAIAPLPLGLARRLGPEGLFSPAAAGGDGASGLYACAAALAAAFVCAALGLAGERFAATAGVKVAGATADRRGVTVRSILTAAQLALVLVVLFAAGQFARALRALYDQPLGFDPRGVATLRLNPPRAAYASERVEPFFAAGAARLGALPGVTVAGLGNCLPLTGGCDHVQLRIEGQELAPGAPGLEVWMNLVDPGYFGALRLPIVRGRGFEESDRAGAPPVALVDRETARRYWGEADPLGQRIQLTVGWPEDGWGEVVGVVESTAGEGLGEAPRPGVYLPVAQFAYRSNYLALRTTGDPAALLAASERLIHELDPDLAVWDAATMEERLHRAGSRPRFGAVLLASFGGLASLLAGLGVHGVASYAVARRRREFGVRLAVGARAADLGRAVLASSLRTAGAGAAIGAIAAWVVGRWLSAPLADIAPGGGVLLVAASLWVALLSLGATLAPSRRAARLDPASVLREE